MSQKVLEIRNLSFGYEKNHTIFRSFNLDLYKGEVISIVGASGSGKSTLFELITQNLQANSGTIHAQKISSIYQDPYNSFHPTYSILEQIDDATQKSYEKNDLEDIVRIMSLNTTILTKKPYELSGGQLQRCSILRALLMQPDILLADEPTSALDNIIALDVMKLLMQFLDRVGILLITHDTQLASWSSDKIIKIGQ